MNTDVYIGSQWAWYVEIKLWVNWSLDINSITGLYYRIIDKTSNDISKGHAPQSLDHNLKNSFWKPWATRAKDPPLNVVELIYELMVQNIQNIQKTFHWTWLNYFMNW